MQRASFTFVKPAVLEAVERVEQRHVEQADQLPNEVDGEQAHNHSLGWKGSALREGHSAFGGGQHLSWWGGCLSHLDEEKRLQQEVEQHVSDDFADAGEGVRLPARHFERQIRNVLPAETGLEANGTPGQWRLWGI